MTKIRTQLIDKMTAATKELNACRAKGDTAGAENWKVQLKFLNEKLAKLN